MEVQENSKYKKYILDMKYKNIFQNKKNYISNYSIQKKYFTLYILKYNFYIFRTFSIF